MTKTKKNKILLWVSGTMAFLAILMRTLYCEVSYIDYVDFAKLQALKAFNDKKHRWPSSKEEYHEFIKVYMAENEIKFSPDRMDDVINKGISMEIVKSDQDGFVCYFQGVHFMAIKYRVSVSK